LPIRLCESDQAASAEALADCRVAIDSFRGVVFSDRASRITHHACRLIVAVALALSSTAMAADTFQPGKDGWLTLFDGSGKERWELSKGSDWKLEGGVAAGTKGELLDYWHWTDFELLAVVRGSGGLRCRVSQIVMSEQAGYWLDLADGTLRKDGPSGVAIAKGSGAKTGDWREVRLVASEGTFTVSFDGKEVARGKDDTYPRMGRIGLAATGAPLELKLLRIRPLGREKHANVPSPDKACFVCHDDYSREKISRTHRAREDDDDEDDEHLKPARLRPKRNGCAGCHGPSLAHRMDEDNVTTPDLMYTRGEVEAACLRCHVPHKKETHRDDEQKAPLPPNPVCTDCHGRHRAGE